MIVGILREVKAEENRVSLVPVGVEILVKHGHQVLVEKGAGIGSGFEDRAYEDAGAKIKEFFWEVYPGWIRGWSSLSAAVS